MPKPVAQIQVMFSGITPDIQNKNHKSKIFPFPKISLNHIAPVFLHRLGNLGKTVSRQVHKRDFFVNCEKLMSCVRPGVWLVFARFFRPTSVLINEDLPTLERPTKATSGIVAGGYCGGHTALFKNCAPVIFISPISPTNEMF